MSIAQIYQLSAKHGWLESVASQEGDRLIVLRHWLGDTYAVHYFGDCDYYLGYFGSYQQCRLEFERRRLLLNI